MEREGFCEEDEMSKGKVCFSYKGAGSGSWDSQQKQWKFLLGNKMETGEDKHVEGFAGNDDEENTVGSGSGSRSSVAIEREHMFDKVVTPSDVGKLNRLVIPKQYAEKYFPLDTSTNEKGLLLNFEDRNGKPWRFRYSYWNSSQSYVMTKGWSRFVKEKRLDAGDIVSFQRGIGELGKDHLYIDWRRRPDVPDPAVSMLPHHHRHFSFHHHSIPWSPLLYRPPGLSAASMSFQHNYYNGGGGSGCYGYSNVVNPCQGSVYYLRSAAAVQEVGMVEMHEGEGGVEPIVFNSVPVVHGKAAAKRLRLFGVNMECPISETDECDILSSTTIPHATMVSQPSQLSPHLQLRLYNGTPIQTMPLGLLNKGKTSMSLDLDM